MNFLLFVNKNDLLVLNIFIVNKNGLLAYALATIESIVNKKK